MIKSFAIITFGCRLNQAESAQITRKLLDLGFLSKDYFEADIVLLNTCTVTHKADKEVRQMIRRIKRENKECFLILLGCWAQKMDKDGLKVADLDKLINLSVKNKDKEDVEKWLAGKFIKNKLKARKICLKSIDKYHKDKKALIKIQEGCNNFCSYCIVPYVRGGPNSESVDKILKQVKQEAKEGIEEIVLTGVNLGSYKFIIKNKNLKQKIEKLNKSKIKNDLALLLQAMLLETSIKKISFGSISLKVFNNDFFRLYKNKKSTRLTSHFHIPLQSGSDAVLKRMRRSYEVKEFLKIVKKLKTNIKNASISTDVIVGFPNETDKEFKETIKTIKKIKKILGKNFNKVHIFRYSYRKETLAAKMIADKKWTELNPEIKKKRARKLSAVCLKLL